MDTSNNFNPYVLGLDLGSNSIGWAMIKLDENDNLCGIEKVGVRVFEAGMEGQYESGKEESRNKKRREARLVRRQIERRSRRYRKLANLLQKIGLLPDGNMNNSLERQNILDNLDKELRSKYIDANLPESEKNRLNQIFIYYLRSLAVEQELEPYALGRVLYHLGQRRGFLSNRRGQKQDDEERGKVKQGIAEIRQEMEKLGAETLGRYFAKIDPVEKRIRGRWTARDMYEQEFYAIWEHQSKYYPEILNDTNKKQVFHVIFYQRPLKSQKEKIGYCQFECIARGAQRNRRRAPWVILKAQRFRLLQKLNDLLIIENKFTKRALTEDERTLVIDYLEKNGDATFAELKKLLKLPKTIKFNLEEGGEKKIPGNRTTGAIRAVIGDLWDNMSAESKDKLVEDIYSIVSNKALKKRLINHWKFTEEQAEKLSDMGIEDGYCNLSRQAIDKFLPGLESGTPYSTLVKEIYGMDDIDTTVELLPPLESAPIGEIRNPTVTRTLSEMRKIVNELVKRYGKPKYIRIETARDLRNTKKEREKIWKNNRELEEVRAKIKKDLISKGISNPTNDDIERYMLAEECNWVCPYTGRSISFHALFEESQFDIEHIIPLSRCLDNSFKNKTLCYHEENRNRKHNRTPFEVYGTNETQWDEILRRVEKFNSRYVAEKLRRFKMHGEELDEFIDNFSSSQLNDTRYSAKEARLYCALLYGKEYRKHVFTVSGPTTAIIRRMWDLNKILGSPEKNREDHRQHAIDAIVIALTSPAMIKSISEQAEKIPKDTRKHDRWWRFITPPWNTIFNEAHEKVLNIIVSHRPERKVSGRLHEETNYSPPKPGDKNGETVVHVRKALASITKGEIEEIVDPIVRDVVKKTLEELGGDPKKAFNDPANYPLMPNKKGLHIPIRHVRVRKKLSVFPVGKNERVRYVATDENHHIEIFETKDKKGRTIWDANVVSMYTAMQRKRRGEEIIQRKLIRDGKVVEDAKFLFSLCKGDMVYMKNSDGEFEYYTVVTVSEYASGSKVMFFIQHFVAKRPKSWVGLTRYPTTLQISEAKKCSINVLGEVQIAHD
ncbi:MAG TPA: type II CRISPR RNA-guided endonuclease Cas9 [Candidatus Hydrogenedens sp.]|nr:type II CRISPR RNA-guided endonuclease Cas9 [Candidatus Hydrogenedens sp.]HPP59221.1 type II CRISPR RNA-guided endonuclease Cas9 [Candidatus Hydrogenedens sp.]